MTTLEKYKEYRIRKRISDKPYKTAEQIIAIINDSGLSVDGAQWAIDIAKELLLVHTPAKPDLGFREE